MAYKLSFYRYFHHNIFCKKKIRSKNALAKVQIHFDVSAKF